MAYTMRNYADIEHVEKERLAKALSVLFFKWFQGVFRGEEADAIYRLTSGVGALAFTRILVRLMAKWNDGETMFTDEFTAEAHKRKETAIILLQVAHLANGYGGQWTDYAETIAYHVDTIADDFAQYAAGVARMEYNPPEYGEVVWDVEKPKL